ncbi:SDR family NAD(P)-dependent oxidoreductase [Micromonospora purpureochromogenes]|uniref:SDR family NAD(P)-dependent oxidoreductase n=1 Tax=Micromonospora purpureochromogenes TaxID=47872 RepID=UPI003F4D6BB0
MLVPATPPGLGLERGGGGARAGWRRGPPRRARARPDRLREAADAAGVADLIDVRRLDVTDADEAAAAVAETVAAYGRLDAVVNNAGAGHVGTLEQETVDDVRAVMEVNFFGVLHVSRAALPHLRACRGRLVTVTSVGGVVGQPFNEAYCAAKFAVEGFMESLAPVAAGVGVTVAVIEPGAVASEFVANVGVDRDRAIERAGVYGPALRAYLDRGARVFPAAQSPADAATVVVAAVTGPTPSPRTQTSTTAREFVRVKLADLAGTAVTDLTSGWLR